MGLAARGNGLCDIDRVLLGVFQSRVKNWEVPKYTDDKGFSIFTVISIFSSYQFLTSDNDVTQSASAGPTHM